MSNAFRELLQKIGSGVHTGDDMSRTESEAATRMMLLQEATPAQIGGFLIAHRIKRPTGIELAGMLDAYDQLGPKLQPIQSARPMMVLGIPYDGRSRTAPVSPLTALILASAEQPVVMHGGDQMPTKYGLPLIEIWQALGVDFSKLSLAQTQLVFETTGLGFVYLPQHFPLAAELVPYRDQIGKRPPFATLELMWCPYAGEAHMVSGFVHPPTEIMLQDALTLRGSPNLYTAVKGLEGSCDLPRDRTAIIGMGQLKGEPSFERLLLHPRDYGFGGQEIPLNDLPQLIEQMQAVLQGQPSELLPAVIWNGGFYLWRSGVCSDLSAGFSEAERLLTSGRVAQKLQEISQVVSGHSSAVLH